MLAACWTTLGSSIPWRLSGLLSGYLPTDTRPQARAKLGKFRNKLFGRAVKRFFAAKVRFVLARAARASNVVAELLMRAFVWSDSRARTRLKHVSQRRKTARFASLCE